MFERIFYFKLSRILVGIIVIRILFADCFIFRYKIVYSQKLVVPVPQRLRGN